jgi:hypothetical protein
MTVVVCVRNPLEVAMSLRRRGASSLAFGLSLWTAYNESVLRETSPGERIVTHYVRYLADPAAEARRVAQRIGLNVSDDQAASVSRTAKSESRHNYFTFDDLVRARVSPRVLDLYTRLCEEADAIDRSEPLQGAPANTAGDPAGAADSRHPVGRFDYAALESHLVRRR